MSDQETYLQKNFDWHILRGFGASKIASVTVLMPFIGYVILYNSQFTHWLGGLGGMLDQHDLSDSCTPYFNFFERLNLLYCGLLSLGLSALTYKLFAPKEVSHYRDVDEYIDSVRPNLTARRIRVMYRTIANRRPKIGQSLLERAGWLENTIPISKASIEFNRNENDDLILDILRNFHQAQNRHYYRLAVVFCAFLFVLGTLVLSLPAITFTMRVLCVIFA
ncbi:hypothetical protein [Lentilitoribacter sp. Alg239-R112]|uniref:hypothetical protein n=1 Tax=Lentilitoribacter sp. Alg239-R112 TaxID=2305987 RepID=UPI0013A6C0C9|nr:hypothetical protein [Lentilitoribacter sp. Alg239-R112]